jgi:hypothetical protein
MDWGRNNRQARQQQPNMRNLSTPPPPANPNDFLKQAQTLIAAEIRMISGCELGQTSADVSSIEGGSKLPNPNGLAGGACTSALLSVLYDGKATTYQQVMLELRQSLQQDGFSQIPQLTSSRPLDLQETPFQLVGGGPDGRRRALLIGINYQGQNGELRGCHNDVLRMQEYIQTEHGYPPEDMLVLLDDANHKSPTRQNIIAALQALVAHSQAGDSIVVHYSGHGGLLEPTLQNVWKKGSAEYDQTIIPLDHEQSGQIRDFNLFHHFVKPLQAGVTVTCIMDCCHSGAVLELPYSFLATSIGERDMGGADMMMQPNMNFMSNLAFLYSLGGGLLDPLLFHNVGEHFNQVTGENMDDYQGVMAESAENDAADYGNDVDDGGDYGDDPTGDDNDNGYDTGDMDHGDNGGDYDGYAQSDSPVVVPGEAIPDYGHGGGAFDGGGGAYFDDPTGFDDGAVGGQDDCDLCSFLSDYLGSNFLGSLFDGHDDGDGYGGDFDDGD